MEAQNRRRFWAWVAGIAATLALSAYTAASLVDEPLRHYLESEVNHRLTGYTVRIPSLSVHPHNLSFDLYRLTIVQDANPRIPVAAIRRLNTTIHWRALFHGRVVADVTFDRPSLHLDLREVRTERASKVPLKDKGWQQALEAVALDLRINRLTVENGDLTYVDPGPFQPLRLEQIDLVAENIRNIEAPDHVYPSRTRLSAIVFDHGRLQVEGRANFLQDPHPGLLARINAEGIELAYFRPIIDRVNLIVSQGTLSASGMVEYSPSTKVARLEKVLVDGPRIEYIHTPRTAAAETARAQATVTAAKKAARTPDLELRIDRLNIARAQLSFVNRAAEPPYRLSLTDASLSLENLSNRPSQGPSLLRLSGKFMGSGRTQASAILRPGSADVEAKVAIEDTDMARMNEIVRAYGKFGVSRGQFSLFSELKVTDGMVSGYVKPLFRDVHVGGDADGEPKSFGRKFREGLVGLMAKVLRNRSRSEVATVVTVSGRIDQPRTDMWEAIGGLLRNAFLRAILPGFEENRAPGSPESQPANHTATQ